MFVVMVTLDGDYKNVSRIRSLFGILWFQILRGFSIIENKLDILHYFRADLGPAPVLKDP